MKKQKKSNGGKNRRQQGNGQGARKAEQTIAREGSNNMDISHGAMPREKGTQHPQARRRPQQADDDQKRKLWDRKQAELAARRAAAETRRLREDSERRRKTKVAYAATGVTLTIFTCALAWYLA